MQGNDDTTPTSGVGPAAARRLPFEGTNGSTAPVTADIAEGLRWYVACAPRAVAVVAGAGHHLMAANAAFSHLALRPEDAPGGVSARIGAPIANACTPGGAHALGALLDRARQTGAPADGMVPAAHPNAVEAWACTVWPAGAGAALDGAIGGGEQDGVGPLVVEARPASEAERAGARQRDVTERILLGALREQQLAEQAEIVRAAAERQEAELAAVFESLPDAVYLGTRDRITRANRTALALFGVATVTDLHVGDGPLGAVTPATLRRDVGTGAPLRADRSPFARALDGATVVEEVLLADPDGGEARTVRCAAAPVVVDGRAVAAVVVHSDVTAERRLEAQLRQAHKLEAVGRLAGGVAHDFNNLLTAIGMNADLAAQGLPPDSPAVDDLRAITEGVGRAAALTRQLLAFSRQQVLQPTTLDLADVVAGVERLLARLIGGDVVLTTHHDPAGPAVVADRGQLEQVLVNLAVNARDAMPDGGTLDITTTCVDHLPPGVVPAPPDVPAVTAAPAATDRAASTWVAIRVCDSGYGMTAATRAQIFEPFFTTKALGQGTGLGLATVYGIVAQSGGHLGVETAPGRGTTVTVYLPAVRNDVAGGTALPTPANASPGGAGTLLLVDDDATVRRAVARLLAREGYTVLEAAGGEEALELAARYAPGATGPGAGAPIRGVITDVRMPGLRGPDLAEQLRATMPDVPVLLISGYDADGVRWSHTGGAPSGYPARVAFLEKPFTTAALAAALRGLLDAGDAARGLGDCASSAAPTHARELAI